MAVAKERILEKNLDEQTVDIPEMEIFRAGNYGKLGKYSESDLDAIATGYDPAKHEAPQTLDHADEGPSYGWVSKIWRKDNSLFASIRNVPKSLADAIKSGRYEKRSAEIWRAGTFSEKPYLRAVSILGAMPPVIKGMQPIPLNFAGDYKFGEYDLPGDGNEAEPPEQTQQADFDAANKPDLPPTSAAGIEVSGEVKTEKSEEPKEEKEGAEMPDKKEEKKTEEAKKETPPVEEKAKPEADAKFAEEIAELKKSVETSASENEKLRKELDEVKRKAREQAEAHRFAEVADRARKDEKLTAADYAFFKSLFSCQPLDESGTVKFGEGADEKDTTPRAAILEYIENRPKLQLYGETMKTADSVELGRPKGATDRDVAFFAEVKKIEKDLVENDGFKPNTEATTREAVSRAAKKLGTF